MKVQLSYIDKETGETGTINSWGAPVEWVEKYESETPVIDIGAVDYGSISKLQAFIQGKVEIDLATWSRCVMLAECIYDFNIDLEQIYDQYLEDYGSAMFQQDDYIKNDITVTCNTFEPRSRFERRHMAKKYDETRYKRPRKGDKYYG